MRKLIPLFVLAFLVLAPFAQAQETYSLPATAGNVASLSSQITVRNALVCLSKGAVGGATCTQAQACTAYSAPGGSGCTAAQARTVNARIYPLTQPGREEYLIFEIALGKFIDNDAAVPALKSQILLLQLPAVTTPNKDAACVSLGLAAGCFP